MCILLNPVKSSDMGIGLHFIDEPTNDLDITTLTVLESYLDTFQGIVITVSHDRYFLDRAIRRIFAFEEDTINQYEGGYSDYALRKEMEQADEKEIKAGRGKEETSAVESVRTGKQNAPRKLKFSYMEQKEYDGIEAEIHGIEEKLEQIDKDIPSFASNFVKLQELTNEREKLENKLEERMDRWMYLEDLAARIEAGEYQE